MGIVRKIAALTAVFAAALLLFVVVCPFAATPTAVTRSGHHTPTAPLMPMTVVAAASMLLAFTFIPLQRVAESAESKPQLSVLNRTCVQLC